MECGAWQRRTFKRLLAVTAIKASPEYDYPGNAELRPQTPDPYDRGVSKRRWEKSVMHWRHALRGQLSPIDWLGWPDDSTPPEAAEPASPREALRSLCGTWVDQKGSTYELIAGRRNRIHVRTRRPSGHERYTRNLVRVAGTSARERVIWGRCRYELDRGGPDALTWKGNAADDVYHWKRLEL